MGNEVDSEGAEFFQSEDQLFDATGEAVELPDNIEGPAGIDHEGVQAWPPFLGAAGPVAIGTIKRPTALGD